LELSLAFGQVLRRRRKRLGLSQEVLGFESGLERNYISMLELGQRVPSLTTVLKLSSALRMPAWELIQEVESALSIDLRRFEDRVMDASSLDE
jgi:transcriptional regulator with XRE-family HTH domain